MSKLAIAMLTEKYSQLSSSTSCLFTILVVFVFAVCYTCSKEGESTLHIIIIVQNPLGIKATTQCCPTPPCLAHGLCRRIVDVPFPLEIHPSKRTKAEFIRLLLPPKWKIRIVTITLLLLQQLRIQQRQRLLLRRIHIKTLSLLKAPCRFHTDNRGLP